jgi:hypothetical protein
MKGSLRSQMRVGRRLAMAVIWTVILVVGLGLGLLVGLPQLTQLVKQGSESATELRTGLVAVAVAMVLSGLWGIAGSYRNFRHSVDLIMEVDRARSETVAYDPTRYTDRPK